MDTFAIIFSLTMLPYKRTKTTILYKISIQVFLKFYILKSRYFLDPNYIYNSYHILDTGLKSFTCSIIQIIQHFLSSHWDKKQLIQFFGRLCKLQSSTILSRHFYNRHCILKAYLTLNSQLTQSLLFYLSTVKAIDTCSCVTFTGKQQRMQ